MMDDPVSSGTTGQTLMVSRVIVGALLMGVVLFAGVVVLVLPDRQSGDHLMTPVAAAGLAVGIAASFVAGRVMRTYYRGRKLTDADLLARAFFQTTLVRAAVLEAAGFLCLMAVLITGNGLGFIGAALVVLLLATLIPTRAAWDRFHAAVAGGGDDRFQPR